MGSRLPGALAPEREDGLPEGKFLSPDIPPSRSIFCGRGALTALSCD